jgi:hypothetical protein
MSEAITPVPPPDSPREFTEQLRTLQRPEDRVRTGLEWMRNRTDGIAANLEPANAIINAISPVLSEIDLQRRNSDIEHSSSQVEGLGDIDNPDDASAKIRDLAQPEDRVREGLRWMTTRGVATADALPVVTVVLNNASNVLDQLDQVKK